MLYNPKTLMVNGKELRINADFRPCIEILKQFERNDLTIWQKLEIMVGILYEEDVKPQDFDAACEQAVWFLNCGEEDEPKKMDQTRYYSWTKDEKYIISGVDKTTGRSCRGQEFLHWWDFVNIFMEINECTFSTILHIRKKKRKGKLADWEREWYQENRSIVDLKTEVDYTPDEKKEINRFYELLGRKEG